MVGIFLNRKAAVLAEQQDEGRQGAAISVRPPWNQSMSLNVQERALKELE